MFVHFPGRSKDEAFVLGQEIADAVTAMFPSPIKLRFEKVTAREMCDSTFRLNVFFFFVVFVCLTRRFL